MTSRPDWGKVQVNTAPQVNIPLGDPTQWGAQQLTQLPGGTDVVVTPQIIAAATADSYSRSWAIIGALTLPFSMWGAPGVYTGEGNSAPYIVSLDVIMGVGQIQLTHRIVLSAGDQNPTVGLCTTQSASLYTGFIPAAGQGPYLPDFPLVNATEQTRPFAAIGALVGHTINIRATYLVSGFPALPYTPPATARLSLMLTAFAAGKGL